MRVFTSGGIGNLYYLEVTLANLVHLQVELQWLLPLFERLVTAVERLAGPLPEVREGPRMATLDDYAYISEDELGRVQMEQEVFARKNMLVPGSSAFVEQVERYERMIIDSYGEEQGKHLVSQLPWKVQSQPNGPQSL